MNHAQSERESKTITDLKLGCRTRFGDLPVKDCWLHLPKRWGGYCSTTAWCIGFDGWINSAGGIEPFCSDYAPLADWYYDKAAFIARRIELAREDIAHTEKSIATLTDELAAARAVAGLAPSRAGEEGKPKCPVCGSTTHDYAGHTTNHD